MRILSPVITIIFLSISCFCNSCLGLESAEKSDKQQESIQPIILTSSATVAVISSIIAGDDFIIDTIHIEGGCPHHYSAKPSDKKKIDNADAAIYIDDHFESFFSTMIKKTSQERYRISSNIDVAKFIDDTDSHYTNWHFWNSPKKTYMALEGISDFLGSIKPAAKEKIFNRMMEAKEQLMLLEQRIQKTISISGKIILLSKSLEPFFQGLEYQAMFAGEHVGLKFLQEFEQTIEGQSNVCIISEAHDQYEGMVSKYRLHHAIVNGENISFSPDQDQMQQYIDYINNIVKSIEEACAHP